MFLDGQERHVVVEGRVELDRLVDVDGVVRDVFAVEHAEDALADGGDFAGVRDISVREDDAALHDHHHGARVLRFDPGAQGFELGGGVAD